MRRRTQIATILFYAFVTSSSAIAASPIGKTVNTSTTVSAGGRTLQKSSPLYFNDVVRTNATGIGQFVFDDGTKLAMGSSASVVIDKFIYKGKRSLQQTSIQASKGAFRYISGAFSGHKVATPYGTIGIRGTAFDFTIRNGKVYILLFRGAVDFCGAGGCKTLRRSCDYFVAGGGRVSDPQPLSTGVSSGRLNVGQIFPLVANQGRLTSQFRLGRGCLTQTVKRNQISPNVQTAVSSEPPAPGTPNPPGSPAPSGKSNKGLGNGGEVDDNGSASETQNPGNGNGNGRNK